MHGRINPSINDLEKLWVKNPAEAERCLADSLKSPDDFIMMISNIAELHAALRVFAKFENQIIDFIFSHSEVCEKVISTEANLLHFIDLIQRHIEKLATYLQLHPQHFKKLFSHSTFKILITNYPDLSIYFIKAMLAVPEFSYVLKNFDYKFINYVFLCHQYAELFFDHVLEDIASEKYLVFVNNFKTLFLIYHSQDPAKLYDLYLDFVLEQEGQFLFPKPETLNQKGPHCAYYAARCAADFYMELYPQLFKNPRLLPRKCDGKDAKDSLRQRSKSFVKTKFGIFSSSEMIKIINDTECRGEEVVIRDEAHFVAVIQSSLQNKIPIILPYAVNDREDYIPTINPLESHWAVIFGFKAHGSKSGSKVYISTNGEYASYPLPALFNSFFNMKTTISECQIEKNKNGEWKISSKPVVATANKKVEVFPLADLSLFTRRLILVHPPLPVPINTP